MRFESREFGVQVRELDIKNAGSDEIAEIKRQLYLHRAVIIKHQQLGPSDFCDIAHKFGRPEPYLQENYRHPDYPLIFVSSNVKRNGQKMGVARTGGYWHSDTSFLDRPVPLTMLTPRLIPKLYARRTEFIDMSAVYSALPADLKRLLEGAFAVHSGRYRYKVRDADAGLDIHELLDLIDRTVPPTYHPAVLEHPVTKEKALYVSSGFTIRMADAQGNKIRGLRRTLTDFAESGDFTKSVTWEVGDVIVWDNRYLIHKSGRYESRNGDLLEQIEQEEETMMFRIIIHDGLPLSL